jgi:hypothetical protein
MDLEVLLSRHRFYNLPSDISALLLDAFPDKFNRVIREPAPQANGQPAVPPSEPRFVVSMSTFGEPCLLLQTPTGEVRDFRGLPAEADRVWMGFRGAKIRPSKAILEQYRAAYQRSLINAGGDRR